MIYLAFSIGGQPKQHWKVLIADPANIMNSKIMAGEHKSISYSFADGYIETEEFAEAKMFQEFDALLEVNEKVVSNKTGFVFYREKPSVRMRTQVQYHFERRLEEVMVKQFTDLPLKEFRKIKQPINVNFRDVYDPKDEASALNGWVGFFFGTLILTFIFLFGMTILRSVTREKSNRIVEVLLASVSPNQLMIGKITGIGITAFVQFIMWIVIIGLGLYFMRELLFPDMLDAANIKFHDLALDGVDQSYPERYFAAREYNQFVELIYNRVQFTNMTVFFFLFFIAGYLFYGSLFTSVGATMGSESDGQQFVLPIIALLLFSLYGGYYAMNYPESPLSEILHYLPFTAPVVVMVKLAQGYEPGHAHEIYVSLFLLLASAFIMLAIAARLYKNGILQFGHRLRLKHIFKWLKSN
jgi:ABC-2 type transport system permease protein